MDRESSVIRRRTGSAHSADAADPVPSPQALRSESFAEDFFDGGDSADEVDEWKLRERTTRDKFQILVKELPVIGTHLESLGDKAINFRDRAIALKALNVDSRGESMGRLRFIEDRVNEVHRELSALQHQHSVLKNAVHEHLPLETNGSASEHVIQQQNQLCDQCAALVQSAHVTIQKANSLERDIQGMEATSRPSAESSGEASREGSSTADGRLPSPLRGSPSFSSLRQRPKRSSSTASQPASPLGLRPIGWTDFLIQRVFSSKVFTTLFVLFILSLSSYVMNSANSAAASALARAIRGPSASKPPP